MASSQAFALSRISHVSEMMAGRMNKNLDQRKFTGLQEGYWTAKFLLVQWTPSNPATLGTCQSVLIRGVASFQGCEAYFGTF